MTISMLEGERGTLRKEFEKLLDWMRDEPVPDVINLPNSLLIALAAPLKRAVGRPVCCTLQGEELFLDGLPGRYREQALALIRSQVEHVDRFIAISEYCATFMSRLLEIPAARISVVPLGINMAGYEARPASDGNDGFSVGYFARIAPEKGLHVLADAYARFRRETASHPARLEAAGYLGRVHEPYLNQIRRTLDQAGLAGEFVYRGALDRAGKLAFLRTLDVLSVPATYDEPKGMFLLEAMAAGVPVVQPRRGAFVEIVERTGGGLLVNPDDPASLAEGLETLWQDRASARSLGQRAFHGVRAHYSVAKSADVLLDVYNALLKRGATSHADSAESVA
jgi:glycosyltransferase involved in cell wall biosynthesis